MTPEVFKCEKDNFALIGESGGTGKNSSLFHAIVEVQCSQNGCWASGMRVIATAHTPEDARSGAESKAESVESAFCWVKIQRRLNRPVKPPKSKVTFILPTAPQ